MTPEEHTQKEAAIDAAQVEARNDVEKFLALPAVQDALRRMDKGCFDEFKAADTETKRQNAWAKSQLMQEFLNELAGIKNSGVIAQGRIETRETQERSRANAQSQRNMRTN